MKRKRGHSIPFLRDPESGPPRPLYLQLYRRISEGVLGGAIASGARLPSARTLASEEGVSRNTVEAAYRQLQVEGFVERRVGSGT
jgi:GntR family transcriptional regulator/MocR family aminotransferase